MTVDLHRSSGFRILCIALVFDIGANAVSVLFENFNMIAAKLIFLVALLIVMAAFCSADVNSGTRHVRGVKNDPHTIAAPVNKEQRKPKTFKLNPRLVTIIGDNE